MSDPVADSLGEYAFWLERQLGDSHRIGAYRRAASVTAGLAVGDRPRTVAQWQELPGFGPSTAAFASDIVEGRVPEKLRRERERGAAPLDPAGAELRGLLKGDLHLHTDASDGGSPLEEMAATAARLGHDYIAVTDHSPRLTVAHGLSAERLQEQWERIEELGDGAGVRVLRGIEVDILANGSLDQSDEMLSGTDVVVASIHSDLRALSDVMTPRMVAAVSNPHTLVLGHCTGRRVMGGRERPPSDFDAELVFAACEMFGVAVEINSRPERQDPPDNLVALARDMGCLFSIDTDAHAPGQLDFQTYGCAKATRAGIDPDRIINTWPAERLLDHARRHRR